VPVALILAGGKNRRGTSCSAGSPSRVCSHSAGSQWEPDESADVGPCRSAPALSAAHVDCVLRRPNEGPAPAWLEHRIARWAALLRGARVW